MPRIATRGTDQDQCCCCRLTFDEREVPRVHFTHSEEDDEEQLEDFPVLMAPVMMDYGFNVRYVLANIACLSTVSRNLGNSTWRR